MPPLIPRLLRERLRATQLADPNPLGSLTGGHGPAPATPAERAQAERQIRSMAGFMPPDPNDLPEPTFDEIGATGTPIIAGVLDTDEYNPDLTWREGIRLYEKMRRSDATVRQALAVIELPLRSATWKIAPASPDPRHIEQASFIETALFHEIADDWQTLLHQICLMRVYGFMLFEKVFRRREDGLIVWQRFAPRLPRTIYRWWQNADRTLYGVQQWTWDPARQAYVFVNIPAGKLLRFTYQQEGDNFAGLSILRSAYQAWFTKQAYIKLQQVGFEREHVGVPVITLPPEATASDRQRAAQIGRNLRSNEQGYVALPAGWSIDWLKTRGAPTKGSSIQDAIRYCDLQILSNVLAGFLALGHSGVGSYAMSNDQSQLFLKAQQADAAYIAAVFHHDAFPQLLRFNYDRVDMVPRLVPQSIQAYDLRIIADAIARLTMAGALRPTVEIEEFLYNVAGIPRPPANLVESTDPNSPAGRRLQPDVTGLTPLPLTPEEQIAIGNRFTRDIERITVQRQLPTLGDIASGKDPGAIPDVESPQQRARNNQVVPPIPGARGRLHEVYAEYLDRVRGRMTPVQEAIYCRLAEDQGRPPAIQLSGDYIFASADSPATDTASTEHARLVNARLRRRRAAAGDVLDEATRAIDQLRDELLAHADALAQLDQRVTDVANLTETENAP